MYGLNGFALIAFLTILAAALRRRKAKPATRRRTADLVSAALLLYNLARYGIPPLLGQARGIPVEFSTISYLVVPAVLLLRWRAARVWAAYAGLMSGFFYYAVMALAGGPIYDAYAHADIYVSMLCHGALLLLGVLAVGAQSFRPREIWKLVLGILLVALNAQHFRPLMQGTERLFVYELMDAAYAPYAGITPSAYYVALSCLLLFTMALFFRLNRALSAPVQHPVERRSDKARALGHSPAPGGICGTR